MVDLGNWFCLLNSTLVKIVLVHTYFKKRARIWVILSCPMWRSSPDSVPWPTRDLRCFFCVVHFSQENGHVLWVYGLEIEVSEREWWVKPRNLYMWWWPIITCTMCSRCSLLTNWFPTARKLPTRRKRSTLLPRYIGVKHNGKNQQ